MFILFNLFACFNKPIVDRSLLELWYYLLHHPLITHNTSHEESLFCFSLCLLLLSLFTFSYRMNECSFTLFSPISQVICSCTREKSCQFYPSSFVPFVQSKKLFRCFIFFLFISVFLFLSFVTN